MCAHTPAAASILGYSRDSRADTSWALANLTPSTQIGVQIPHAVNSIYVFYSVCIYVTHLLRKRLRREGVGPERIQANQMCQAWAQRGCKERTDLQDPSDT